MTNVYCDASCDVRRGISVWACLVITPKGNEHVYTGRYYRVSSGICELRAVVKAIGKVKTYQGKLKIHTDYMPIVLATADPALWMPISSDPLWHMLKQYLDTYENRLSIRYVPRNHNPAHNLAYHELCRLRNRR